MVLETIIIEKNSKTITGVLLEEISHTLKLKEDALKIICDFLFHLFLEFKTTILS